MYFFVFVRSVDVVQSVVLDNRSKFEKRDPVLRVRDGHAHLDLVFDKLLDVLSVGLDALLLNTFEVPHDVSSVTALNALVILTLRQTNGFCHEKLSS